MDRFALIRPHAFSDEHITLAGSCLARAIIDVHDLADIAIRHVSLSEAKVELCKQSIDGISHIMFLGLPWRAMDDRRPSDQSSFEEYEWGTALVAALGMAKAKIFNRGYVCGAATQLNTKPAQIMLLSRLGWNVPAVAAQYQLRHGAVVRERPFASASAQLGYVVLTQRHVFIYPPHKFDLSATEKEQRAVKATRDFMRAQQVDWLTIPMAREKSTTFACGASIKIPSELGVGGCLSIMRSALAEV